MNDDTNAGVDQFKVKVGTIVRSYAAADVETRTLLVACLPLMCTAPSIKEASPMKPHLFGVLDEVNTDPGIRSRGQLAQMMAGAELMIVDNQPGHIVLDTASRYR